ncbi:hypothetical protein BMS3Bbin15_00951 [archaeon BMS3Bbin15]|nr:hypothetical protein BMS3Bbin15_00951 [archaeon BMS3Bbin15]
MDYTKCENCNVPVSHCDGMTRYKCGEEKKEVKKFCVYDRFMKHKK